ncbi:16S rRNA (uracil(1498)-N(3))-methyltransferase [Amnibacterium kyonggiense]|uniref:Ribosomal RNA small subunit methyltransferase E n=1 Tax=Amnibacterium kyonggiense TaxID=595671 RepID=A0A4R7FMC3_9MICO|nr:16S rRNA (uracil(1498)-N(3))-methyltransferase [Amnibacterium kyonggiense]TDS77620.1 16S rRNA (uracil1498-N3)-methyltransferase [Amnibacterium kyonggiense]
MAHFYLASSLTAEAAELTGEEARHAAQVARLRVGEAVVVGDGAGRVADAEAVEVARDRVVLRVLDLWETPEPSPRVVLVQALAKGGRDESAIQAATELGVAAVVPWQSARSVTRWTGPKVDAGVARWSAIVREAGKQSMRPWAAEVRPLATTTDLAELAASSTMLLLEPTADARLLDVGPPDGRDLVLVVGPEGGIAPEERARLEAAGATAVRLGPLVLRTSTAGPAALAALAARLDLWP